VQVAGESCPSLKSKRTSPHMLRDSAAMELLQAGVDRSAIALWFGNESIESTHTYLQTHVILKAKAGSAAMERRADDFVAAVGLRTKVLIATAGVALLLAGAEGAWFARTWSDPPMAVTNCVPAPQALGGQAWTWLLSGPGRRWCADEWPPHMVELNDFVAMSYFMNDLPAA
jgi:hypothetical protein